MDNKSKNTLDNVRRFPNNYEAEQSLLCCLLIDGNAVEEVVPSLESEAFYNKRNRIIYEAIQALYQIGTAIDIITVNDMLEKSGKSDDSTLSYLTEIQSLLPSGANFNFYSKILHRDYVLRAIITACNKITEQSYKSTDEIATLRYAEELIYGISKGLDNGGLTHISKATSELMERIDMLCKNNGMLRGLPTGFKIFDSVTNGLQNGDLIILAARPSVGKTAFAFNIVANTIKIGEPKTIAIFSLEMPAVQLAQRLVCNMGEVKMTDVSKGDVKGQSSKNIWKVNQALSDSKIYVDDRSLIPPSEVLSQCRRLPSIAGTKKLDLVIVDYLQLMLPDSFKGRGPGNRQEEVASMSRMMKIMAKELDCPVILLSQMSRGIESREDNTPMLSDLRESGSIEQDADIVLFLSREIEEDKQNSPIKLTIAKHRNGELRDIRFNWQGEYMRFVESQDQSKFLSRKKAKEKKKVDDNE
ncbi:MAG: replicative DNA helicase [Clostridiales bacterium]|nr:replicative DNA helicase [Clostridiales bacterium]